VEVQCAILFRMNEMQIQPKILFAIITCPQNSHKQQVLRDTWTREIPKEADWVFVQGDGDEDYFNPREHILALNTEEGYIHLARKTYDLVSYVARETDYDYVIKIDDDAYVEPQNVVDFIKKNIPDYVGKRNVQQSSSRNITYAQGGFYILSRKSIETIVAYTFEDGDGSSWWYGAQKDNKAWTNISEEMRAITSIEDVMVGQILSESGVEFRMAFGSFDFYTRWYETRVGGFCVKLFLKICTHHVLSFHPIDVEVMKEYYSISQESRKKNRGVIGSFVAQHIALFFFSLGMLNTYLYTPLYIWQKNK